MISYWEHNAPLTLQDDTILAVSEQCHYYYRKCHRKF